MKLRGVVEGVQGTIASPKENTELSVQEEPDNPMLLLSVSKGLEARVLQDPTPYWKIFDQPTQ